MNAPLCATAPNWLRLLRLLCISLLLPATASAGGPVQTFFVTVPREGSGSEAFEVCRDRFAASLVRAGDFRANQDASTQQSVSDCLGDTASATAKRACEVSMANIEVDFVVQMAVRQIGQDWNWSIKALSPAQGAAQVWGGDRRLSAPDAIEAAYAACDSLAQEFACSQGQESACANGALGRGPVLTIPTDSAQPTLPRTRAAAQVSALDVFPVTPSVVNIAIDGKAAGSSQEQVTGVLPGRHEVTLSAPGYFDLKQEVVFEAGLPAELRGVSLKATTASLRVNLERPESATVLVSGRRVGASGTTLSGIAPGSVEVTLRAPGYRDAVQTVELRAGELATLADVRLEPLPATLTITVNVMGAEVLVDGAVQGRSSGGDDPMEVAAGAHEVVVRKDGYTAQRRSVTLAPGGSDALSISLRKGAGSEEVCDNGQDDDLNGTTDCEDPLCRDGARCRPTAEICGNGEDDDGNGQTDCDDWQCSSACAAPPDEGQEWSDDEDDSVHFALSASYAMGPSLSYDITDPGFSASDFKGGSSSSGGTLAVDSFLLEGETEGTRFSARLGSGDAEQFMGLLIGYESFESSALDCYLGCPTATVTASGQSAELGAVTPTSLRGDTWSLGYSMSVDGLLVESSLLYGTDTLRYTLNGQTGSHDYDTTGANFVFGTEPRLGPFAIRLAMDLYVPFDIGRLDIAFEGGASLFF